MGFEKSVDITPKNMKIILFCANDEALITVMFYLKESFFSLYNTDDEQEI